MHLLIPYASALSPACAQASSTLLLPRLTQLLARLAPGELDAGDEYTLNPPHERALARAIGLHRADGCVPWAALAARRDGIDTADAAWGAITPVHWQVGRDHITLADPEALQLDADASRACFEAVRDLFESIGFRMAWGGPLRWYAAHESFESLPCASIDRAIGRNVDVWLPADPRARLVRRLQNEVQMLLYTHPLNDAREARGELTVNSFWLSGCGRLAGGEAADEDKGPRVEDALRAPALAEDWADWDEAWRRLDAGAIDELLARDARGEAVTLTLCGERHARSWTSERSRWRRLAGRWRGADARAALEGL